MRHYSLLLAALALSGGVAAGQAPESPSIWREVLGVSGTTVLAPTFTRPHMPGLRVTKDGRVGVMVEGSIAFALMTPEKLTMPFLRSPAGAHTMSSEGWSYLGNDSSYGYAKREYTPGADLVVHACLWDDQPPFTSGGNDIYDVKVLVTSITDIDKPNLEHRAALHVTPVRITVANPKTAAARILSIVRLGATVSSPKLPYLSEAYEPVICGDGRLLIIRLSAWQGVEWTDPNTQARRKDPADIVYAYYPSGATADPTQWTNLIPISFAPYDRRINKKFGFAMTPFRDPEGNLIPPGKDIGGSYPWMDRDAKNLFLETLGDRSKFFFGTYPPASRYPQFEILGDISVLPQEDTGGKHQGVSFLGLWSNGKLVMVDNLNNDIDYAMGRADAPQTRDVELFDASRDPDPSRSRLRMGYGRATARMPYGENENGNIIDSVEARFTYRKNFKPMSMHDVVWPLTNGKQTDEVAFDDHIDPDAFIIASMAGSLTYVDTAYGFRRFEYHDGWQHPAGPFNKPIRLQNAANGRHWNVPKYGQSHGKSRLEPAATGGVRGKGFWLTGDNGVTFAVPTQSPPQRVHESDWFFGLFVDCRHDDDATERNVVTFPDGTSVRLYGRSQVVYTDGTNPAAVHRITVPAGFLPYRGWAHLGFQILDGGHRIDFHINGMLYDRWTHPTRRLFQMPSGTLTLGKTQSGNSPGVKGWIDEFKVIAHSFDMETMCNHAGGTLIALDHAYRGEWKDFADKFPVWVHDEITAELRNRGEVAHPLYACFHRYDRDHGVHLDDLPPLTNSMRQRMQFPEGPLFHNAPRPQSTQNKFCISCHYNGGALGLSLDALRLDPSKTATEDPRRQPMQPAARIHGFIPAGLVDTVTPAQPLLPQFAPLRGLDIDKWMLPAFVGPSVVESLTVVDPVTGEDRFELRDNMVLDPVELGLSSVRIRANLRSAQGSVTHQWNSNTPQTTHAPQHEHTIWLTPGTHRVSATPAGGVAKTRTFTVAAGSRVIANYRTAFRDVSPARNWTYAWNDAGDVKSTSPYRKLNWSPAHNCYNARGLSLPDTATSMSWGELTSTGGHTGQPRTGSGHDRFALAGYTVQASGTFRVQRATVQMPDVRSNGGTVVILVRDANSVQVLYEQTFAAGAPFSIPTQRFENLSRGQTIFVGIGPNGNDWFDDFTLDFDIAVE